MKYFQLCLFSFIFSCQSKLMLAQKSDNDNKKSNSTNSFRILKIDSTYNVYIIYARRNDSTFKIVSIKDTTVHCTMLKVGEIYNLKLVSCFEKNDRFPYLPPGHIGGIRVGKARITFDEEGIVQNLFSDEHLKGLCLFNSEK